MNRKVFKRCVRLIYDYVPENWNELHKEYEASLYTAPVPDNEKTAKEFLMHSFQFGLSTTQAIATVGNVTKAKCVPATSLTVADVNRAIDWLQVGNGSCLQEGNNPMCNSNTKTEAQTQRDYLDKRLTQAAMQKNEDFQKTFKVNNPEMPSTYKELIDAIKNDKFEVDKKAAGRVDDYVEEEGRYYGSSFDGIKWKLDNSPDFDGYREAQNQAEKQRTVVKDAIMGGVYADGLKAIQDFEAWTPAGNA